VRDLLFPSAPPLTDALRTSARAAARAFADEVRAITAMFTAAEPEQREFVAGEVACVLHVSPATGGVRLSTALAVSAHPRLLSVLDDGRLTVPHVLALLSEVEHLEAPHAAAVLAQVLDGSEPEADGSLGLTPGELRSAARRAAIVLDPAVARRRREAAKKRAGLHGYADADGMARLVVDCTAVDMATALAAVRGRAMAMTFDDDLTEGQKQVAALLHALGCERSTVQAVLECPVETAVDLLALAGSAVWTVDVRMPLAVALGLSDHPAVLSGYGPIDADQARALLPVADLVRACVDGTTGEVLAVDPPVRARTWQAGDPDRATALRDRLLQMATTRSTLTDLSTDGYVPSEALGRLVDLRDVTSTFPGDSTPARRTDRDHRIPWPLGPTSAENLQNINRRQHRAKHAGWTTRLRPDGSTTWTSPTGGVYTRRPRRTPPPPVSGAGLPALP
jgi:hypothetical protein